jgi:hypothetical protein
MFENFIKWR